VSVGGFGLQLPATKFDCALYLWVSYDFSSRHAQRTKNGDVVLLKKFSPDSRQQDTN